MQKSPRSGHSSAHSNVHMSNAALYLRVSTGRQAEQDLSIPDQKAQARAWCQARGWTVAAEFVEPGASATDDKRPVFQQMIEQACSGDNAFDVIVVHSYSRFFRDAFGLEFYLRKLKKSGVRLVSITQELGDDPAQVMLRQVIALFDEYQSKETAKHVLRSMKENARQGFWNGASPPFGYRPNDVERRGDRVKKKLVIDEVEADVVRLMFRLFLEGDGTSGPLGVKAVVKLINAGGHRTRRGAHWGIGPLHRLLTDPLYCGQHRFNRKVSKTGQVKDASEVITTEVPAIIEPARFDRVQAALKARNPKVTAPRVVTGPILLTGLAVCGTCGGGMTLRTGTSKQGNVYKYYTCSRQHRQGKTGCEGRSIRMDKLDGLVTEHLATRLFVPERLTEMLAALSSKRCEKAASVDDRIARLEREAEQAETRLGRLYKMVEDGIAKLDDVLKRRIDALKLERDQARAALERAQTAVRPAVDISPLVVERFGAMMRENLTTGTVPFRKAMISSVVDRVEVDDHEIRIIGDKGTLERAVLGGSGSASGGEAGVRSLVRNWRRGWDSNPRYSCPYSAFRVRCH
jgi:site-specific DNA recombinase